MNALSIDPGVGCTKLLMLLADGQIHSGVALAGALGVSRMTVSNRVAAWIERGLEIEAIPARGYRLREAFQPLTVERIKEAFDISSDALLLIKEVVTSTNDVVRNEMPECSQNVVCFAEYQTEGRGRRGRSWMAVPGGALCGSWGWRISTGVSSLQGLSLAVGVVVAEVLAESGVVGVCLKWPNDLMMHQGKLGGILIEVAGDPEGFCQVIVGVGLNVNVPKHLRSTIDQSVADLSDAGVRIDRNQLAMRLCVTLGQLLDTFPVTGFAPWQEKWQALDAYAGKPVILTGGVEPIEGVAAGVNELGALRIETDKGLVNCFGGEVSLRSRG